MANEKDSTHTEKRVHVLKWYLFIQLIGVSVFWILAFVETLPGQNFLNISTYFYFYVAFMCVFELAMIILWCVNFYADHNSSVALFRKHLPRLIITFAITTFLSCVLMGTYISNKGFMHYLADVKHYVSTFLELGKQISTYNTMLVDFRITFLLVFILSTFPVYLNFVVSMLPDHKGDANKNKNN